MNYFETGFGNYDTQDFARFRVLHDRDGHYPDWETSLRHVTDQIVGSNNFETQILGFSDAQLTLRLEFDDAKDFRAFQYHWGKKATLILFANFTRHEGEVRHILGRDYELYVDTLLLNIASPAFHVGGQVECSATFMRSASGLGVGQW